MGTQAVLHALRFRDRSFEELRHLTPQQWNRLLPWCDRCQVTLLLGELCGASLPVRIRGIIASKYEDYQLRMKLLRQELAGIATKLETEAIPFILLKGFTHCPALCSDPIVRAQGDIDLWCPDAYAGQARQALERIGYSNACGVRGDRHLAPLVIPKQWQWNGKVSEVPVSTEIHHQLWSDQGEHISIGDLRGMWYRRELRSFEGREYHVLCLPDLVGFAALHFFLHLIHGDLPLQRLWEIANFLHSHSGDEMFWVELQRLHSPELLRIEAMVFAIAEGWFHCEIPQSVLRMRQELPSTAEIWLREFLLSPLKAVEDSNKNYLWLRLSFITNPKATASVIFSALLPSPNPARFASGQSKVSTAERMRQAKWIAWRSKHHLCAVLPTFAGGVKWIAHRSGFKRGIGAFFAANLLYDTGEFLFVILYSLYLLSLGAREDTIGLVASAMTAGNLIGSPIAAALQKRIGLRGLLLTGAIGGGLAGLLRTLPLSHSLLFASAALNGILSSFWGVAYAPAVASVVERRNRSTAFALFTATAMSLGIIAGVAAVRVPQWITTASGWSALAGKQMALAFSCALVLLSAIPAASLKLEGVVSPAAHVYPRGPFIRLFVCALFLYTFATASFNTFGIAYLSLHLHLGEHRIGAVFSTGQTLQVMAMLSGPLLIRKLGERRFIFLTAAATAALLLLLAVGPGWASLACYLAYLTFQYMGEPSLFALLMNRVRDEERSGASTLMLVAMSVASTIAATIAGRIITGFGYEFPLTAAAVIAALAAGLFLALPEFTFPLRFHDNKQREDSYDLIST